MMVAAGLKVSLYSHEMGVWLMGQRKTEEVSGEMTGLMPGGRWKPVHAQLLSVWAVAVSTLIIRRDKRRNSRARVLISFFIFFFALI